MKPRNYVAKAQQSGAGRHKSKMKRYKGIVVFRYYQVIELEAENREAAELAMYEEFDLGKADGESEIYDMEECDE